MYKAYLYAPIVNIGIDHLELPDVNEVTIIVVTMCAHTHTHTGI